MKARWVALILALVLVLGGAITFAATRGDDDKAGAREPDKTSTTPSPTRTALTPDDADNPAYKVAMSSPVEDSLYPNVGDPSVDALHYDLALDWDPEKHTLAGLATIAFRSTATADDFRLDFGEALEVEEITLDGAGVEAEHNGKDLVINAPVTADEKYVLVVEYAGTPEPVRAPTARTDIGSTGWTITPEGEAWTMQEPYGAFTWYPVNDQPSDKALYDFTISVPSPWVGVANGQLKSRKNIDGQTVTKWTLGSPAASYLVTMAIGDFVMTKDETKSGVPMTYWTHRGDAVSLRKLKFAPVALAWLERHLGPYPFKSLGYIVVDSESGMETQTMITLGNTDYALSPEVLMHEAGHQWYGDVVSPTDWRDMWMNEGMTMYLQLQFEADRGRGTIDEVMDQISSSEAGERARSGPPGDYNATMFGAGNVYYSPALMWHELRRKIGDKAFWAMVKKWPTVYAEGNATRAQYLDWVEKETGQELSSFFNAWLMHKTTPPRG